MRAQAQPQLGRGARRHGHLIPERALGTAVARVDRGRAADHVVVDAVLGVRRDRLRAEEPGQVGLVLAEQRGRQGAVRPGARDEFQIGAERVADADRGRTGRGVLVRGEDRPGRSGLPGPGVAEPRGRQHVQGRRLRARVSHLNRHQDVVRVSLRVVHLDDPVPVLVERPGVQEFVLGLGAVAPGVLGDEVVVGVGALRVVIAPPVPRVARHRVQVPPVLLDVLAVIALLAGKPERPLLEDRVAPVPQRQRQAQPLLDVAEPGEPVLAPAVGAGAGVIVRQVIPGPAVRAVILPDRAPLPLADVGSPPVPVAGLKQAVLEVPEARPRALAQHSPAGWYWAGLDWRRREAAGSGQAPPPDGPGGERGRTRPRRHGVMTELKADADPAEVGFDPARLDRIDRHFRRYVDDGRLPGWLITVSRRGRLAHVSGYGSRDLEAGLPVETDTLWRIYSMTKPITSVAAMMLYEEGAFELTDPVSALIPSFGDVRVYTGRLRRQAGDRARHRAGADLAPADPHRGPDLRLPPDARRRRAVPRGRLRVRLAARHGPGRSAATPGRPSRCCSSPARSGTTRWPPTCSAA